MIPRLILLLALIFAIFYIRQKILKAPAGQRRGLAWKYGLIALAVLLVGLAVAGRVHWVSALVAAALPFIRQLIPLAIRYFPLLQRHYKNQQGQQNPTMGQQSEVATPLLKMAMDHDGGKLSGEVLAGPFAGSQLDSLNQQQLLSLLEYCQQQDQDSSKLLISYLNHRFGDNWQQGQTNASNSNDLSEREALDLLGLNTGANEDDIIQAHRRLMQKVHPDRGGNDYLAAKINQAKELLLAGLRR